MKHLASVILLLWSSSLFACKELPDSVHMSQSENAKTILVVVISSNGNRVSVIESIRGSYQSGQEIEVEGIESGLKRGLAYLVYTNQARLDRLTCKSAALAEDQFGYDTPIVIEIVNRAAS